MKKKTTNAYAKKLSIKNTLCPEEKRKKSSLLPTIKNKQYVEKKKRPKLKQKDTLIPKAEGIPGYIRYIIYIRVY